ncbi:MAG: radical SAM protein [Deltaproteobacteria bacterium]|nr:radical SAM protein [Deltaproteobacteria bacterium]MBM4287008.1 radical SAM protein [Deltaproteobacteria bacterium]
MREAPQSDIAARARARLIPLYATLELTHRCNLACVHCLLEGHSGEELSTTEAKEVIDQLAEAGTLELVLTGGEALLRPDFFDLAAHARERHLAVTLLTNGTLIDRRAADALKELRPLGVHLSLYGVTGAVHEAVTGTPRSFERTLAGIHLLLEWGLRVQINSLAMRQNVKEIPLLDHFCRERRLPLNLAPSLFPTIKGSLKPYAYLLEDADLEGHLAWEEASGRRGGGLEGVCNAGFCNVAVSPLGEVFPCNALRLLAGNVRAEPLGLIWQGSPVFRWLRRLTLEDFEVCASCSLLSLCPRCPGQTLGKGKSILYPSSQACKVAKYRELFYREP